MSSPSSHVYNGVQPHPIIEPQPAIPVIQPTVPADPQFQTTTTATNHRGDAPTPQPVDSDYRDTDAQWGMLVCCVTGCILIRVVENYGDSSGRLWMIYLTKAEKEDKEIIEGWKGEADGILVFVSAHPSIFCIYSI